MSRVLSAALAALSVAAFAGFAQAQMGAGPGSGGGMRPNLDANGDGVVSASEFDELAKQRFQRMDENHDGVIDAGELAALKARMEARRAERPDPPQGGGKGPGGRADRLAEMDADKDGRITEAEALAVSQARFAKLDQNQDGKLDQAEQQGLWMGRPGGGS
jgi:Ca2+-binding EF-hand superfamily protein